MQRRALIDPISHSYCEQQTDQPVIMQGTVDSDEDMVAAEWYRLDV
jgi:hypothetical protein